MVEDSSPRIRAGKRRSACRFSLWIVLLATHVASTHMAAGKGFSLGKVTTRATTAAPMLAWPAAAPGEVGREWPASLRLRGGRCKRRATAVEVLAAKRHKGSADRKIVTVPVVKGSAIRLRAFPDLSPKIIVFIPLTASASSHAALRLFHDSFTPRANSSDTTLTPDSLRGPVTIALPPHCSGATPGQRVTLLSVAGSDSIAMLDALKVADCAVLVHAGDELPDPTCGEDQQSMPPSAGENAVMFLRAQGLPSISIGAMNSEGISTKARTMVRKTRARLLQAQVAAYLRSVSTRAPSGPAWRHPYAYLLGLSTSYDPPAAASYDPLNLRPPAPSSVAPGDNDGDNPTGEVAGGGVA
ncbi:hypothetical protein T484DRAFT_1894265, partial [Baffinella frigidus]